MKNTVLMTIAVAVLAAFNSCSESSASAEDQPAKSQPVYEVLGFESEADWGGHLVTIAGCDDCHTPKKMTEHGPEIDKSRRLMGHPAGSPIAEVDREEFESKGYVASNGSFTSFIGPWGISYSANLTPDPTGIGNWSVEQFQRALREGIFKGMEGGRPLMPPMPWFNFTKMSDSEVNAIFAFLNTLEPIDNVVPALEPPVSGATASAE